MAHRDHRVADFALTWRGKHDAIVAGYNEVAPLDPEEWALLTPLWWAQRVPASIWPAACATNRWTIGHILRRSPLMGADAAPYPG